MARRTLIEGIAAPLPMSNLDTDQIMPKQFLRGIDKAGLAQGVLFDLRFEHDGEPRTDFVLNRPEYARSRILVAGENFGCGSSREHAVWGLLQYGIQAIVAPSFGEIFYSNAMNNRLLLITLPRAIVDRFLADVRDPKTNRMTIDIERLVVRSAHCGTPFALSARYRRMFIDGMDQLDSSLGCMDAVAAFECAHWDKCPWLKSVARVSVESAREGRYGVEG